LLIKVFSKSLKYILFLSGRRDRTCGFDNPLVTSCVSDAQNCAGKLKFLTCPSDLFVTSCVSDAQNCGKMQISELSERPFRHFRVCRALKTVVKCKFVTSRGDPFVTSCVPDASKLWQNAIFSQFFHVADRPLRHFVRVGRLKTVAKCNFFTSPIDPFVTSCASDASKLWQNAIFSQFFHVADRPFRHFVRVGRFKTVAKCNFFTSPIDPFGRSKLW